MPKKLNDPFDLDFSSDGGQNYYLFGNAPSAPKGGACLVSVPSFVTSIAIPGGLYILRIAMVGNVSVKKIQIRI